MKPYADTNFLTRLYLDLPEIAAVDALGAEPRTAGVSLPITWLHRVELCNALQLYVFRSAALHRRVTVEQAAIAWASFKEEMRRPSRLFAALVPVVELENQAEELSLRHTRHRGFRTYDLLHVASALLLECDTFWSFDIKALQLAKLEGFKTEEISS